MRKDHALRRLVVDGTTAYLWSVRHRHGGRPGDGEPCREVLTLYQGGPATRLVFRAGEGRYVADGHWYSGCVTDGRGNLLNLREPGVVRALVDEARRRGLLPGTGEVDGWEPFEGVAVSRAAAATPGVPRGCPPGP
ncbi:hypothetical protein [Streptomyces sp. MK7]|uniref:hypothetical protein n=1 Tax=Streptomyces sp. MK7 TaxID=3067635 RepID=UPI00292EFA69|nr:hypothetical protein [Streptomyces sp. MK7]